MEDKLDKLEQLITCILTDGDVSDELIFYYIQNDCFCYMQTKNILSEKIKRRMREKLSYFSFIKIKFDLIGNHKTIDCSEDSYCKINNSSLYCSFLSHRLNEPFLSLSCIRNFCVALTQDYELLLISQRKKEKISENVIKFCVSKIGFYLYIKNCGSLVSSNNLVMPFFTFRDIYVKEMGIVAIKQNGHICPIDAISGKVLFENTEYKYDKVISDGNFFGGITEEKNIVIFNSIGMLIEFMEGPFTDIECSDDYFIAIKNGKIVLWKYPLRENQVPVNFENNNTYSFKKVKCEKNYFVLLSETDDLFISKNGLKIIAGNFIEFETCATRIIAKNNSEEIMIINL